VLLTLTTAPATSRHTAWTTLLLRHGAELEAVVQQVVSQSLAPGSTSPPSASSPVDVGPTDELLFALDDDSTTGWLPTSPDPSAGGRRGDGERKAAGQAGLGPDADPGNLLRELLLISPAISAVSTASSSSMATSISSMSLSTPAPGGNGWADWSPEIRATVGSDSYALAGPSSWCVPTLFSRNLLDPALTFMSCLPRRSSDFDAGLEEMFSLGSPALDTCHPATLELGPSTAPPTTFVFRPADLLGAASAEAPLDTFPASLSQGKSSGRSPALATGFAHSKSAATSTTTAATATASAGPSRPLRRSPTGGPLERSKFSCDACLLRRKKCNPHPRPDGSLPQIGDCSDCVRDATRRKLGAVECTYEIRKTNVERARRNGSLREPFHHVAL
jgi:hypothetical protein